VILPLLLLALRPAADAFVAAGPAPTPLAANLEGVGTGFTPRPTEPPKEGLYGAALLPLLRRGDAPLAKRQAADGLCGYESGIPSTISFSLAPHSCDPSSSHPSPVTRCFPFITAVPTPSITLMPMTNKAHL
jgi:hypothetical protein